MKKIIMVVLLFVISSSVYAAAREIKEATVREDFSIQLNEEKVTLKSDIVIIDGLSYIPLREVSELLGIEVSFDEGVIHLVEEQERNLRVSIIENKLLSIDENILELQKYISLVEKNMDRRKSLNLDVSEAEKEILKKENDILTLEENKNNLLAEMEVLINGD